MTLKYNSKQSTMGVTTPNRLFLNLEGAFSWNGTIYDKLSGKSGVYIISVIGWERWIPYLHGKSNIIYVGESEDIGKRLHQHKFTGINRMLKGYVDGCSLNVYYRNVLNVSELKTHEAQMIHQFENIYGGIPMCNNQRPDVD
ncbi:GIY-YIG nuclease family protein [Methanococcoides sp. NM1]|uniref:GIY-YIG nuclease family protein n=1 Tax=Methanococcoides sp. NM1 TaxID=1201013 RepID=UPI001082AD28|nr:GIY-YIG nuclease family protein [Methanococcoides sp. NM1]